MNEDIQVIRSFIGSAVSQGIVGYRADHLFDCLRRIEVQLERLSQYEEPGRTEHGDLKASNQDRERP